MAIETVQQRDDARTNAVIPAYVSHVSDDGTRYEAVCDHLREVAEMASEFAAPFGAQEWARAAGTVHDIGKYSKEFQLRILHDGPRVDHSTAGAAWLHGSSENLFGSLLAYCVAGHHGGLPDGGSAADGGGTLIGRLKKAKDGRLPDCSAWSREIEPSLPASVPLAVAPGRQDELCFSLAFLTRMVFSCLVDADYLCTERFMQGGARSGLDSDSIDVLRDRLERRLSSFYPPTTPLNAARCGLLDDCLVAAKEEPGVFSLTAPTGSGKTYALMRFALNHATRGGHAQRRVIVAEPYTSIIEQNADVYRAVFGEENVLEHHANFDFDEKDDKGDDVGGRLRLATENWDAPIVVTTNVQLFESLYSNKTSRCRRLHNIAQSVIVLDEAQMIPTKHLLPCVKALAELVKNYGCTVVLCTATQPALGGRFEAEGLSVREIVSDVDGLFGSLARVRYQSAGKISDEVLAGRLADAGSALCIVNSRRQARVLYELLSEKRGEQGLYHLTTLMHPNHRKRVLAQINECMRKEPQEPCVVVATSLVEAGVDLDFPVVYRAIAGVDSMVQAAGRCNREGKRAVDDSSVYLFEPEEAYAIPQELKQRAAVARGSVPELNDEGSWLKLDAPSHIARYFEELYFYKGDRGLDEKRIVGRLSEWDSIQPIPSIQFASVASDFRLIDEGSFSIVVPDDEVRDALERLELGIASRADMRRLSGNSVSVYKADRDALVSAGAIKAVADNTYVLLDENRYCEQTGLDTAVEGGEGLFW